MKTKRIKLILVMAITIMIICTVGALANEFAGAAPEERADAVTEWMQEKLSLGEDQVEPVRQINLKYARMNNELMNSDGSRVSKLRELKAIEKDRDTEMKKVLNENQFKTYEDVKEELRSLMKEKIKEKRAGKKD